MEELQNPEGVSLVQEPRVDGGGLSG
jgi:hypothetical protein